MNKNLEYYEDSKIYIVCPSNKKTGGTELLHQLCRVLVDNKCNALISYYLEGKDASKTNPTPEAFRKYIDKYNFVEEIEDSHHNIIVLPEVCIGKHRKYKKIQKIAWWLSVDNYYAMVGKISRLKKYGFLSFCKHIMLNDYIRTDDMFKFDLHLYQSRFAYQFLIGSNVDKDKTAYLSDYVNDIYIKEFSRDGRKDIVVYNPKKGFEFTSKIIEFAKYIKFIPLINMTNEQVLDLLNNAKVYIDFGNHPGKDRIPREAAMSGCCVITNRRGSAKYYEDVRIPDSYKFDDNEANISDVVNTIKKCFADYETIINDFEEYREMITQEKEKFKMDAIDTFTDWNSSK